MFPLHFYFRSVCTNDIVQQLFYFYFFFAKVHFLWHYQKISTDRFLYIFPMWGQLFQPISFSDIWRGSDKLYTTFHRSKGIVFLFSPAANNKVRHMLSPSHRKLWACLCSTKYKYRKNIRLVKSWWSSAKVQSG